MKIPKKKGNDLFYKAMGGINPTILDEIEEMERMEGQTMKKKMNLVAVAACCVLLMGAGTGLVRELADGSLFEWKNEDKTGFHHSGDDVADMFYEERVDGLYYIFDGAEVNVTEYCSDTDYVVIPDLDAGGTGYVAVLGGEKGERGLILNHYEQGELLIGQSEHELVKYSQMVNPTLGEVVSPLPQFVWNHHAIHFIGHDLDENWYQSAKIIENDYGTAEKVGENLYFVQGHELGEYNSWEQLNFVSQECYMRVDWLSSFGGSHSAQLNQEADTLELSTHDDWTEEREAELRAVLDEIGFPYTLEFVG